jgi:hypothetical protein
MSSSYDVGKQADANNRIEKSPCPKSPDGKHEWINIQGGPSWWDQCKHCEANLYGK